MIAYEAPTFLEVSLNAEIGNYQDELDHPSDGPLFAEPSSADATDP